MGAQWGALQARITELRDAWNQVVNKYAAILRVVSSSSSSPSLDVARFLAAAASVAGPGPQLQSDEVSSALDTLRAAVTQFVDSWGARDTDLRAACQSDASSVGPAAAKVSAAESALEALSLRLAAIEASVTDTRRQIVETQKAQLAQLLTGGASSVPGADSGLALAASLASANGAQQAADTAIDALYAERKDVKAALAAAEATVQAARVQARATASGLILKTHARWRAAAERAQADVATLADEVALRRIQRTQLLAALDAEVDAEHGRIMAAARGAYATCAALAGAGLEQALGTLGAARSSALGALEASEAVLGTELHSLMASSTLTAGGVAGIAIGMPQPAVRLVDDAMRTAVSEHLGRVQIDALHVHAVALQPVVDGLAAGLSRPVAV